MFQPLVGSWTQIIGVFASSGNVKSQMLSKIVLEATVLCEQAGLLVHYVCTDGATWNRSMWHNLGVYGNGKNVKCKVTHPCDEDRFLHFISDFPHLAKCVRNTLLKQGLNTHLGRAHWEHVSTMWKLDNNSMTLKVAPKLTRSHIYPNGFDKMRVDLAFHIFSREAEHAISFYKEDIERIYPNAEPTRAFVDLMARLIEAMTSRFPAEAMRPGSRKEATLDEALRFLDEWEAHAKGLGFLRVLLRG
ncbi:hypothetical protein V5799_030924 [Amblyomma americanum]|uniref:Transposable element n=1 Tax=Amblyomma americanum TaxID=6943 RepID=A0AAQ4ELP7_AMBAM